MNAVPALYCELAPVDEIIQIKREQFGQRPVKGDRDIGDQAFNTLSTA